MLIVSVRFYFKSLNYSLYLRKHHGTEVSSYYSNISSIEKHSPLTVFMLLLTAYLASGTIKMEKTGKPNSLNVFRSNKIKGHKHDQGHLWKRENCFSFDNLLYVGTENLKQKYI